MILAPDRGQFCRDPMNFVDFVAIMPYFITTFIDLLVTDDISDSVRVQFALILRIVRILRTLRILKLSR